MPYLKHKLTGDIYPWHELLAKREDMELYEVSITPPKYITSRSPSSVAKAIDKMVDQIDDSLRAT